MNQTRVPMAHAPGQLTRRIQRIAAGGLLLSALLVGLAVLLPMYQHLAEETHQRAEFDSRLLAQISEHLLERFEGSAAQLSSRSELRNALQRYNHGELSLAELQAFSTPRLQDALAHAPEIVALLRLDARQQPVLGLLEAIPAEAWPLPAAHSDRPVLSAPLQLDGQTVLLIGTPILSREGLRLGTDIAAFSLATLVRQISEVPLHPATHSHLLHLASGQVMHVHDDRDALSEAPAGCPLRSLLGDAAQALSSARALPLGSAAGHLAFVSPLPTYPGWAVALLAERDRLYADARREVLWPLLALLLLTLGGGLVMHLAIRPLARRMTEQAQTLELVASVFDSSNEGILLMDPQQRVIAINPAACRISGYAPEAIVGQPLARLVVPEDPELHCAALWARAAHSGHWQGEVPMRRADGSPLHAWLSLAAVFDEQRRPRHVAAVFIDISARKAEEQRIRRLAYRDKLTGLPNRALAQDRLQHALRKAQRLQRPLAVLFLDLDRFKPVNDTYGHAVGDHLLQAVAARMEQTLRAADTVARLGGDEFLVILEDIDGTASVAEIAERLVDALQTPFAVDGHVLQIGTSIGIALYPEDGEEPERLVHSADTAMYRAKEAGRNRYVFHAARHAPAGALP